MFLVCVIACYNLLCCLLCLIMCYRVLLFSVMFYSVVLRVSSCHCFVLSVIELCIVFVFRIRVYGNDVIAYLVESVKCHIDGIAHFSAMASPKDLT